MFIGLYCIERGLDEDGLNNGLFLAGSVVYAGVVMIANMKILGSFNIFQFWGELLVVLSILSYFIVLTVMDKIRISPDLIGVAGMMLTQPTTYFSLFFMLFLTFTVDKISQALVDYFVELNDNRQAQKDNAEREFYDRMILQQ